MSQLTSDDSSKNKRLFEIAAMSSKLRSNATQQSLYKKSPSGIYILDGENAILTAPLKLIQTDSAVR